MIRALILVVITSIFRTNYSQILPRQKAPQFTAPAVLPGGQIKNIKLSDYAGKYVVLVFYPYDFTYVCPTELVAFSNSVDEFNALQTQILGISVDSQYSHLAWTQTPRTSGGVGNLSFPLVSDFTKQISKSYNVMVQDENDDLYGVALRGLFIINPQGIIRSFSINDAPVGRSINETLRLIQAFQFTDTHGEVCPANWKPGQPTIIPDQLLKEQYFSKIGQKDL